MDSIEQVRYPSQREVFESLKGLRDGIPIPKGPPPKWFSRYRIAMYFDLLTYAWRIDATKGVRASPSELVVRSSLIANSNCRIIAETILRNLKKEVKRATEKRRILQAHRRANFEATIKARTSRRRAAKLNVCTMVLPTHNEMRKMVRALAKDARRRFEAAPPGPSIDLKEESVMVAALDLTTKEISFFSAWSWKRMTESPDFRRVYLSFGFTIRYGEDYTKKASLIRKDLCSKLRNYKDNYDAGRELISYDLYGQVCCHFAARQSEPERSAPSRRRDAGVTPIDEI